MLLENFCRRRRFSGWQLDFIKLKIGQLSRVGRRQAGGPDNECRGLANKRASSELKILKLSPHFSAATN